MKKQNQQKFLVGILSIWGMLLAGSSYAAETANYLKPKDIWDNNVQASLFARGRTLACPAPQRITNNICDFTAEADKWPLTFTDPNAKELRIENGIMRFIAGTNKIRFGFGNYAWGDKKPYPPVSVTGCYISSSSLQIRMREEKPDTNTAFVMDFRWHGDPLDAGLWSDKGSYGPYAYSQRYVPATIGNANGSNDWQTVTARFNALAEADGCGLEITTQPGNIIELDWLKITSINANIYARKVITIPKGTIFSAKATVSSSISIYVNDTLVREGIHGYHGGHRYNFVGVDLKPYLKPGKNVIGLRELSAFVSTPVCWMAGAVQMASGETIPIETGLDWKCSLQEEPGWLGPDFDDAKWLAPGEKDPTKYLGEEMHPYTCYVPGRVPVYCGQLELENPYQKKLFYDDANPVRFIVCLPAGLALTSTPQVAYAVWSQMNGSNIVSGAASAPVKDGETLCYEIALKDKPARGVYSIVLDAAEGKEPRLHRQENFIVVGKIPMPGTEGKSWDDGMKLTLVDEINCADTNDSHPFADAALYGKDPSKIVSRNGLTYREASPSPGSLPNQESWMSWTISFKNLGKPHYVEIEYPDDDVRIMEVQIHPLHFAGTNWTSFYSQETAWTSAGVQTGGRYPNTKKFQMLRFLVWSHEPKANVLITKAGASKSNIGAGAAAAKIRVYEIEQLPALDTKPYPDGRRFGLWTERASVPARTFNGSGSMETPAGRNHFLGWFLEAERHAQYCRFTGQNAYFIGSYQYTWENGPVVELDTGAEGCSLTPDLRDVYINVLGANGIMTYAAIEYRADRREWSKGWIALHQALAGKDFMFQVDKNGVYQGGSYQRENPMVSELAFESFRKNMIHIVNRYSIYPSWKGLALVLAPLWEGPCYDNADLSFDDQTIRLFEKETGIKIPVEDATTLRFGKRSDWLMANAREKWFDWRSEKMATMHEKIAKLCKEKRSDLEYSVVFEIFDGRYSDGKETKPSLLELFRNSGYDPRAFRNCKNAFLGRDVWSYCPPTGGANVSSWDYLKDKEFSRLLNEGGREHRVALVRSGFDEWTINDLVEDTGPKWFGGYMCGHVFPAHQYLADTFAALLIDNDIDTFEYGWCDSLQPTGGEQELREFIRSFVSLPRERFTVLTENGLDKNICIKECKVGKEEYLLLINPGWWKANVRLALNNSKPVLRLADGVLINPAKDKILEAQLPPYGVVCFSRKGKLEALKAEVNVGAEETNIIKEKIAEYENKLNTSKLNAAAGEELKNALEQARQAFAAGDLARCWDILMTWSLYRAVYRL